jgi:RNA polymerase sigma-70 factor (ECF subfamily)
MLGGGGRFREGLPPQGIPTDVLGTLTLSFPADPATFFSEFYLPVYRFVSSASGAVAADVEDLVQETLLEAWRGRTRFRGESEALTWVLGIAKYRVLLRRRSLGTAGRHERGALEAARSVDRVLVPEELLESEEMRGRVRRALEEIEEAHSRVLVLRYFEGLAVREIAHRLGESEKAVESRLHRAKEAFRDRLKLGEDDDRRK